MKIKTWEEFYQDDKGVPEMLNWANTHSHMVAELMQYDRVLEVGTGTGLLSGLLSRYCRTVVSLDNNCPVLDTARRSAPRIGSTVNFVRGDAFAIPFADGYFDAAFSQGLFEHFKDQDILGLVREQLRVAKRVYASIPSVFYPHISRFGPGLVGNERLKPLAFWCELLGDFDVKLATYYSDFKMLTFAGKTMPWPAQILLALETKERAIR